MQGALHHLAAFTTTPDGGNPAGVWIGDTLPSAPEMQRIAAEVGASETAFVAPASGTERTIRYFSPEIEVPFCGHATIATGAVLGELEGDGTYRLRTSIGEVPVTVQNRGGRQEVSLTSVMPRHEPATEAFVNDALSALRWARAELDPAMAPVRIFAGSWHLLVAAATAERLADLHYDFEVLKAVMLRERVETLQLIWSESERVFHSRNPFPVGGVVEDPATGSAAAALGGYLRDAGFVDPPATILIRQGETMGRPSRITLDIPASGGIVVSGSAVRIGARS